MNINVIQWIAGPVGRSSLGHIIENPDCDLVGLYVHSLEKVGMDAGDLVGLQTTGVKATQK